jgi:hypothetical protein
MGLKHTFSGGCDAGDNIADTAPEASPAGGCPVDRDTCNQDNLFDPIHNYMDYSDDNCMYEFTPGQADAMQAQYEMYRILVREDLSVGDGIPTDPLTLFQGQAQTYIFAAAPGIRRRVTCSIAGDNGDADVYMRSSSPPDLTELFYDCADLREGSNEVCFTDNGKGSIYVTVYAYEAFENVVLTCVSSPPSSPPLITLPVTLRLLNGVASDPISVATGEEQRFTLDVTPGSWVTCETTGGPTGDVDLYVRYNAAPVIADGIYDCASYSSTDSNEEACALIPPGDASILWATIQGWSAAEKVTLTCTSSSSPSGVFSSAPSSAPSSSPTSGTPTTSPKPPPRTAPKFSPPKSPDTVQALSILALGVGLGGGGIDAALAPVVNANDFATFAADGALGTVATGASGLLPTKEQTAATFGEAIASIEGGLRGSFGP